MEFASSQLQGNCSRILLVGADEENYRLISKMIGEARMGEYRLDWAGPHETGSQALQLAGYEAVLLVSNPGDAKALNLLRSAAAGGGEAAFILLMEPGCDEVAQEARQAGATLCLSKSELTPYALELGVRLAIEIKRKENALRAVYSGATSPNDIPARIENPKGNENTPGNENPPGIEGSGLTGERILSLKQANQRPEAEIAERERIEAALITERQRFAHLFDALPVYLILLSPDYRVPFDNRFFRERFGESKGRRCYEYLFRRSEPCEHCESFKVLETLEPHEWEWTGPDGRTYYIYDFPFNDLDGSPLIMEVGIDITARKRAEAELEKHHQNLEVLVEERTRDLEAANAQLRAEVAERKRAEKMLRSYAEQLKLSNQALEDFAFVASHDLQEPLRKIRAFGDRLNTDYKGTLDEAGQDYIRRMQAAAERMQGMLDGLLTYSRITTQGKQFEAVDLNLIVREVLSDLEVRLAQTGGQVEVGELPMVEADPVQMRQLFQNLCGNALKFHRPGVPPQVTISGRVKTENWVEISIADNGIGFESEYTDQIFKPFHRLRGRGEYEGAGMGLAICKKILERHCGGITVKSRPGEGSTFTIVLPVLQSSI